MSAVTPRIVLNYLEDKKKQWGNRNVCIGQDAIAAALGATEDYVATILESLKEQGKVHNSSPKCWALGSGRLGRW